MPNLKSATQTSNMPSSNSRADADPWALVFQINFAVSGKADTEFQYGRQVDGRLATQDHDGTRTVLQSNLRFRRHGGRVKACAGPRIPTRSASDAKVAAQIASAQGDGKGGNQFQFVRDFNLGGEKSRFGSGVT